MRAQNPFEAEDRCCQDESPCRDDKNPTAGVQTKLLFHVLISIKNISREASSVVRSRAFYFTFHAFRSTSRSPKELFAHRNVPRCGITVMNFFL
jgi:hypothetical protein